MRIYLAVAPLILLAACSSQPPPPQSSAVVYEGARLINAGVAQDNIAIVVDNDQIIAAGPKGSVNVPPGAAHVDLTGKTVIPALVDTHSHLGWQVLKTGAIGADTYTMANLVDHLRRIAYYGVAATRNLGIDPGETIYELRAKPVAGAALIRTAGRGMARPNAGPGREYWRPVAYGIASEADARAAVRELAAKKVDIVKIWVDDRNGTVKKLTPDLYRPIIDEAHKAGLKVVAHIFYLADAKELLKSGIDGFAHLVRDKDMDDEVVKLFKMHPDVWVIPNLPENPDAAVDYDFIGQTIPASEIQKMKDAAAKRSEKDVKTARDFYGVQARNLAKLNAAGVKIGFGTDSSTEVGWNIHSELADMVTAGMTPAQVLTAATKTAAEIVGLNQLGSVETGKSADFIVLDADPLADINNTKRIHDVILRGERLDRAAASKAFTAAQ